MNINRSKAIKAFGHNLRKRRKEEGLSQEKLGERAGVHTTFISRTENCKFNVSLLNMERIANGLGCSLQELLEGC